jgi:hypothetical protein
MASSCGRYHRESLSLFPESRFDVGFQNVVVSAISWEGTTAFFEGYVVKSGWGLGARQSC